MNKPTINRVKNPGEIPTAINVDKGDGSDGSKIVFPFQTLTLTRDMNYTTLTVLPGGRIKTNGYRIFVKG